MNIAEYMLYCLAVVVMIATPGPVMLLVASAGLKDGFQQAIRTIFGTNLASLILIAISVLVLKGVLTVNVQWLALIKLAGCLYIFYLGMQIIREVMQMQSAIPLQPTAESGGFQRGLLVGISNPKDIIFFAAFFPQFVNITPNLNHSLVILTISWIILDFLTLSLVYCAFRRLAQSTWYGKTLLCCGLILIFVAIYGIYTVFSVFID